MMVAIVAITANNVPPHTLSPEAAQSLAETAAAVSPKVAKVREYIEIEREKRSFNYLHLSKHTHTSATPFQILPQPLQS